MRHEKTVSVSKIRHLWEPWEEDETPRKNNPQVLDQKFDLKKKDNDDQKSSIAKEQIVKSIPINNSYLPNLKTLSLWFR